MNISVNFPSLFGWDKETYFFPPLQRGLLLYAVNRVCPLSPNSSLFAKPLACVMQRHLAPIVEIYFHGHQHPGLIRRCIRQFQNIGWETAVSAQVVAESHTSACSPLLQPGKFLSCCFRLCRENCWWSCICKWKCLPPDRVWSKATWS